MCILYECASVDVKLHVQLDLKLYMCMCSVMWNTCVASCENEHTKIRFHMELHVLDRFYMQLGNDVQFWFSFT